MTKKHRVATFKHPSKKRAEKTITSLEKHLEEHPKNTVAQKHLQKAQKKYNEHEANRSWQENSNA